MDVLRVPGAMVEGAPDESYDSLFLVYVSLQRLLEDVLFSNAEIWNF